MSELQHIPKIETVNEPKASQILRETKLRKISGKLTDGKGGYCAVGVLAHYYGVPDDKLNNNHSDWCKAYDHFLGNKINFLDIASKNDFGCSFYEIADWLESKGL